MVQMSRFSPILDNAKGALLRGEEASFLRLMAPVVKDAPSTGNPSLSLEIDRLMCAYLCRVNKIASQDELVEMLNCPLSS
jgi:hypothetical protein